MGWDWAGGGTPSGADGGSLKLRETLSLPQPPFGSGLSSATHLPCWPPATLPGATVGDT